MLAYKQSDESLITQFTHSCQVNFALWQCQCCSIPVCQIKCVEKQLLLVSSCCQSTRLVGPDQIWEIAQQQHHCDMFCISIAALSSLDTFNSPIWTIWELPAAPCRPGLLIFFTLKIAIIGFNLRDLLGLIKFRRWTLQIFDQSKIYLWHEH